MLNNAAVGTFSDMAGTITQVGIYRFLIFLVWLSVPVTAYFLVQADQDRFSAKSLVQRGECIDREEAIRRYSRLLSLRTGQVHNITNPDTRAEWQSRFSEITRDMENELRGLRGEVPSHYPSTDLHLLDMEQRLNRQIEAITEAARNRSAYIKAGRDLEDRARDIQIGRDTAAYYRSIGAYSIAEMIDDDVDIRERELNKQVAERNRRARLIQESINQADHFYEDIREDLNLTAKYLAEDEKLTYQMDLRRRFEAFDLRVELARLAGLPEVSEFSRNQDSSAALGRVWLAAGR